MTDTTGPTIADREVAAEDEKADSDYLAAAVQSVNGDADLVEVQLEHEDSADDSNSALKSFKLDDERFTDVSLDTDSRRSADAVGERPVGAEDDDSLVEEKEEQGDDVPSDNDGTAPTFGEEEQTEAVSAAQVGRCVHHQIVQLSQFRPMQRMSTRCRMR
jgi:hypothetical protein